MPELSIIVPVYKVELYLRRCIDSILAQTFRDFELILIDDGSPDNCGAICDEYAAKDSRIIVIHQENQGVSAARNAGLDIACGTYLGFVDSDDWIEPEMYETMINTAKEKQVDVVVCGINYFEENGTFIRSDLKSEGSYDTEQMLSALFGMPNPLGGGCVNKLFEAIKMKKSSFAKGIAMAEDWLYLFHSLSACDNCQKIGDPLYNVTERFGSATRTENIDAIFEPFTKAKLESIELAREVSSELESKAIDKYLDDCLRFLPVMCTCARETSHPYKKKLWVIKTIAFRIILTAYLKNKLPRSKLNGYIVGLLHIK